MPNGSSSFSGFEPYLTYDTLVDLNFIDISQLNAAIQVASSNSTSALNNAVNTINNVDNQQNGNLTSINNSLLNNKSVFTTDDVESNSGSSLTLGGSNVLSTMNVANGSGITNVNIANNVSPGVCNINIGAAGDIITFGGSLTKLNSSIIESKDTTFTLNNGGAAGSSSMAGIYIEESGVNSLSYMRVSGDRTGIELKGYAGINMLLNQSLAKTDSVTFSGITSTLTGSATSFTSALGGDVSGLQASTVVGSVGGSSSVLVHKAELLANASTSLSTGNTIVKRAADSSTSVGKLTCTGLLLNTGSQVNGALLAYQQAGSTTQYVIPSSIAIGGDVLGTLGATKITSIGQGIIVNGNVQATSITAPSITTSGTSVAITQTGDSYGSSSLTVTSHNLYNGALLTNSGATFDNCDLSFTTGNSASAGSIACIRNERRAGAFVNAANTIGTGGEFTIRPLTTSNAGIYIHCTVPSHSSTLLDGF